MKLDLTVTDSPAAEDIAAIGANLSTFNDADVGPAGRMPLAVIVRGEADALLAGIARSTFYQKMKKYDISA